MRIFCDTRKFIIIMLLWMLFPACAGKIREARFGPSQAIFKMLIAGDVSDFKDALRNQIVSKYRDSGAIQVVSIARLKEMDPMAYDVILIMDTCMAWSGFNPAMKAFLDRSAEHYKIVLFITAGDPDWKYRYKGMDAITSASETSQSAQVFGQITTRIDAILAGRRNP